MRLSFLERFKERRWQQQAINRAYTRFGQQHPEWAAALFDRHFLEHAAADALRDPLGVQPLDLAQAWTRQFGLSSEERRRVEQRMMPAACAFIRLFRAELNASFTRFPLNIRLA